MAVTGVGAARLAPLAMFAPHRCGIVAQWTSSVAAACMPVARAQQMVQRIDVGDLAYRQRPARLGGVTSSGVFHYDRNASDDPSQVWGRRVVSRVLSLSRVRAA